ncbi:putative MPP superfamily phosphohydrolase [Cytobacillus eiseniae]|uniref:MPP superfamily phosphohydrolase n=1 Tax=Cytobacillus eiseniae TaxID=762947 RepID=A0ABS4RI58_9BACI|nr:metallophosphoesterase [Cytobacillus eiseniae]MBP2241517.1 putative MPP superfamily phosphohydrolase [Cytobacillus eiseniae]
MALFFIVFLLLYFCICFYIGYNGWKWLKAAFSFKYKKLYITLITCLSLSFFVAFWMNSAILEMIGGYWLVIVGYGILLLPIANLVYFLTKKKWKVGIGVAVLAFFAFVFIYGSYNAWTPVVREYEVTIDKPVNMGNKNLKILMASDLHIGTVVGNNHIEKLVKIVEDVKPDIVFLPGDIINDDITPYVENKLSETMEKITAPYGVFAVPGNHDDYGGHNLELKSELDKSGIAYLMDETILVEDEIVLIGRMDYSAPNRKSIEELMKDVDTEKPIIVLDHQPREISIAQENRVDMIFSGHSHRGQLAPAHLITQRLYENDWGYLQKEQLHSFTSSGFGLWGPALRIGSQAEVMVINVTFE